MNKIALTAAGILAAAAVAAPASAVTVVATQNAFAAPDFGPTTQTFTFNSGDTVAEVNNLNNAGFQVRTGGAGNASVQSFSVENEYAMPMPGDESPFAVVQARTTVDIFGSTAQSLISLYLGSVDTYNEISVLDTAGEIIRTFTGTELLSFANPVTTPNGSSSYRVTFSRDAGDVGFGGLRFASTTANSLEFDNLVFAVPEPSTWALMLAGFGMVGMAMRSRRRRTTAVFA